MQTIKEKASNVAASAKAGMDKTKATVQEKVERVTAHNPAEKEMATEKKEERVNQAETNKQEARQHHAGAKEGGYSTGEAHSYSTTGAPGAGTGLHQKAAFPGYGTGEPTGRVVEGVERTRPVGVAATTGTARPSAAHNPQQEGVL